MDFKFYGHAGFKFQFLDEKDVAKNIYINVWPQNPDFPVEEDDADVL